MKGVNKTILVLATSMNLITSSALAEEKAVLQVSGVVCSFCAQGIQKRLEQTGAVKTVNVDLDKHEVSLEFIKNKTLSGTEIGSLLESAGYNLVKLERSDNKKEISQ
jgi:periplasmic mercuric ion binding protein